MTGVAALAELTEKGWTRVGDVLNVDLLDSLRAALATAEDKCAAVRAQNAVYGADGSAHHLAVFKGPFLSFLNEHYLDAEIGQYFGGPYILNSYGASVNRPGVSSYLHNVHRDVRTFSADLRLMLNVLVMLDDFTVDNGATYFFTGSHLNANAPNIMPTDARVGRGVGQAGDLILFDSRLWHAAAPNKTQLLRRALTLTFTPPFIKPQFDYPRALGYQDGLEFHPRTREILGYSSRTPATLEEWYQPPETRFYRPGQG